MPGATPVLCNDIQNVIVEHNPVAVPSLLGGFPVSSSVLEVTPVKVKVPPVSDLTQKKNSEVGASQWLGIPERVLNNLCTAQDKVSHPFSMQAAAGVQLQQIPALNDNPGYDIPTTDVPAFAATPAVDVKFISVLQDPVKVPTALHFDQAAMKAEYKPTRPKLPYVQSFAEYSQAQPLEEPLDNLKLSATREKYGRQLTEIQMPDIQFEKSAAVDYVSPRVSVPQLTTVVCSDVVPVAFQNKPLSVPNISGILINAPCLDERISVKVTVPEVKGFAQMAKKCDLDSTGGTEKLQKLLSQKYAPEVLNASVPVVPETANVVLPSVTFDFRLKDSVSPVMNVDFGIKEDNHAYVSSLPVFTQTARDALRHIAAYSLLAEELAADVAFRPALVPTQRMMVPDICAFCNLQFDEPGNMLTHPDIDIPVLPDAQAELKELMSTLLG